MNEPLLNHFHALVPFLSLSLPLHRTLRPFFFFGRRKIFSSNSVRTVTSLDFTQQDFTSDVRLFYIIFYFLFVLLIFIFFCIQTCMYSDLISIQFSNYWLGFTAINACKSKTYIFVFVEHQKHIYKNIYTETKRSMCMTPFYFIGVIAKSFAEIPQHQFNFLSV